MAVAMSRVKIRTNIWREIYHGTKIRTLIKIYNGKKNIIETLSDWLQYSYSTFEEIKQYIPTNFISFGISRLLKCVGMMKKI